MTNKEKVAAIHKAMADGKSVILTTYTRAIKLSKPEHLKVCESGNVYIPRGKHWDFIFNGQVDQLYNQIA